MSNLAMPCRRSPAKPDPTTPLCPSLVFKCGDNVRQDVGCLQSFRMFNQIWAEAGLVFNELPVHAHYYGVSPVGGQRNMGVFEYVAHCVPVKKVKRVTIMAGSRDRMVVSAAGSFIGAYVLGVRDRHYDNILVRDDGVLFHIDFSHLLGDQVTIDTDDFAITPDLKDWMSSSHWDAFLDLAVHAFCELRRRVSIIIPFICMMFEAMSRPAPEYLPAYCAPAGLYADDKAYIDSLAAKGGKNVKSQTEVEEFLRQAFMLHLDMETACTTLRKKLSQGPTRYKTRFKNAIHGIATAM